MADRRLQVFHAVAKHLSFTKAADDAVHDAAGGDFPDQAARGALQHAAVRPRAGPHLRSRPRAQVALDYAERILALSAELDTRLKEMSGQAAGRC